MLHLIFFVDLHKKVSMIKRLSLLIYILPLFFLLSCEKQIEETENRDAITGEWNVLEQSVNGKSTNAAYTVHISRSPTFVDEVYIYNFFNINTSEHNLAYVDEYTITIQDVDIRDFSFRGSGSISKDHKTIDWVYWVEDPQGVEQKYETTYTFIK